LAIHKHVVDREQQQALRMAGADPAVRNEIARPDNPRPLLRDFSVEVDFAGA